MARHDFVEMMNTGEARIDAFLVPAVGLQQGKQMGNAVFPGRVEHRFRIIDKQGFLRVEGV